MLSWTLFLQKHFFINLYYWMVTHLTGIISVVYFVAKYFTVLGLFANIHLNLSRNDRNPMLQIPLTLKLWILPNETCFMPVLYILTRFSSSIREFRHYFWKALSFSFLNSCLQRHSGQTKKPNNKKHLNMRSVAIKTEVI